MRPGEQQPEHDHNLLSEKSYTGDGPDGSGHWRDAREGGWFSFDLKTLPDAPQDLVCTYWGSEEGNRAFDVLTGPRSPPRRCTRTSRGSISMS